MTVLAVAIAALVSCSSGSTSSTVPSNASIPGGTLTGLSQIQHIIVIYQENWSFDALYARYPGANGATTAQTQVQYGSVDANSNCSGNSYVTMTSLTNMPPLLNATGNLGPWPCGPNYVGAGTVSSYANAGGSNPDPAYPSTGLAAQAFNLAQYDPQNQTNVLTGDITHVFWHNQIQIDNGVLEPSNGANDKYVAYSSNPGYVLSQYDATNLPEGKIAQHYTMGDNGFASAFGGSFLNHQWLICACTPQWNQAMPSSTTFQSTWNSATKSLRDANITLMPTPQTAAGAQGGQYWVVNTTQTANNPHNPTTSSDQLLAPIPATQKTIGDLLTDATPSISWKWYSGDWSAAVASASAAAACTAPGATNTSQSNSPPGSGDCFQFHHQPFNYYARWGSATPANCANPTPHLCDEQNFFSDLTNQTLPAVAFVKPVGVNNEHPNYSTLLAGQNHVQQLMAALCNSPYWANSIVIITYDEFGGRYDHVTPPKIDQWGPGTRVPFIIASPYAKANFVDHTQYETDSILALIEKRFGLSPLGTRDAAAAPFTGALNFSQSPLACQSS
jgi:phospholipase C